MVCLGPVLRVPLMPQTNDRLELRNDEGTCRETDPAGQDPWSKAMYGVLEQPEQKAWSRIGTEWIGMYPINVITTSSTRDSYSAESAERAARKRFTIASGAWSWRQTPVEGWVPRGSTRSFRAAATFGRETTSEQEDDSRREACSSLIQESLL